jgi:DNA-binding LytR/AlgR family response regulator
MPLKAFDYAAFGYLLKPIDPVRLDETIQRYSRHHTESLKAKASKLLMALKKLVFRTQKGIIFIDPKELLYCEADGNYTDLHFGMGKKETVSMNLGHIEQTLNEHGFFRVSRSCVINLSSIKSVEKRAVHTRERRRNGRMRNSQGQSEPIGDAFATLNRLWPLIYNISKSSYCQADVSHNFG